MRCRECAAEVAVTGRVCSRCEAPIVGRPTVVGAVIRHLTESYEGTNVAGVVLMCASALVGIFFILGSMWLYVANRDLAAHGVRTQGQVVYADADGSDKVVYTVDGTDYQVPAPEVGDRLPGDAVTVVYDPRDPVTSNLEDDWRAWQFHWILLGLGLFLLGWPAMPVVAGVFEADGPVGRRLPRARPARRQPETPPTPPGDTVVAAVSDAAGTAVRARVAEQAPREPYVPGSGDKVPAELRLVLDGYAGIACGWFAGGLACAVAVVFVLFDADIRSAVFEFFDGDIVLSLFMAVMVCGLGLWWAQMAFEALKARIRFSRLLRRPSDPRTATVTASKRGGRTLILDIPPTGCGYQSLSEVRLALWLKAGLLVPGETVNVYGRSGGKSELLIRSPQRGRAFLGTVTSQSALQPPVRSDDVAPAPDAVVVAQAVERFEAVRKNVREAVGMAIGWGMVVGVIGITVLDEEDAFWSDATLVVAIAATITVVVFVVRTVGWAETTRVEVHPHEIVTEAVWWWRRSPTRVAIGFDEITSVDLDYEDGRKLLKVQTALGRTLSGIPDGPGRGAALAIGQRLVAYGRAHTIQNDDTRIHLGLDGSDWSTY
jgi:hypothetical protein